MTAAPITALVDVEQAISRWLRASPAVTALAGDRIYTEIPAEKAYPMARAFRVGGGPDPHPYWLDRAEVQLDAWGGSKREAYTLLETAMRALTALTRPGGREALEPADQALGVLARITYAGLIYLPDTDVPARSGAPRPRYLVTATATTHPAP
jgi:hypothetical protein